MGRVADSLPPGSIVAIDTALFIYQLEDDAVRRSIVDSFFVDLADGAETGVASVVAL
jgi:hypothetical protein